MIAAQDAVRQLAVALGDGPAAMLAAAALVEADVLGHQRFGIDMLAETDATLVPAAAAPAPVRWVDCAECCAPLAVADATLSLAIAARQFGVAAVFLRGIKGFGRLAPFVRHLADVGLLGLMGAEGPPFVAPHGGTCPVIGTNPLALAMGQGADRVVIDIATGSTTMADIRKARANSDPLAEGMALDAGGQPTRIAAEVAALLPRGGQVGSLLGLMVELLAGIAGGGRGDPQGRGVFLLAFDPAVAGGAPDLTQKLAALHHDWTQGGGYWPKGGGLPVAATLDADFECRLAACIGRYAAAATGP